MRNCRANSVSFQLRSPENDTETSRYSSRSAKNLSILVAAFCTALVTALAARSTALTASRMASQASVSNQNKRNPLKATQSYCKFSLTDQNNVWRRKTGIRTSKNVLDRIEDALHAQGSRLHLLHQSIHALAVELHQRLAVMQKYQVESERKSKTTSFGKCKSKQTKGCLRNVLASLGQFAWALQTDGLAIDDDTLGNIQSTIPGRSFNTPNQDSKQMKTSIENYNETRTLCR